MGHLIKQKTKPSNEEAESHKDESRGPHSFWNSNYRVTKIIWQTVRQVFMQYLLLDKTFYNTGLHSMIDVWVSCCSHAKFILITVSCVSQKL